MSVIRIEWLTDSHSCETCGSSFAEGARVFVDGRMTLDLAPVAHCYGGDDYQENEVFARILQLLGHSVQDERRSASMES